MTPPRPGLASLTLALRSERHETEFHDQEGAG